MEVEKCEGYFEIHCSSGDLEAKDLIIKGNSRLCCSSGNAIVILNETLKNNISVSSSSGNATINFNGTKISGRVEMTAKVRDGRIKCPINFENEETFENYGQEYITKSFGNINEEPLIRIKTASGSAKLLK